MDKEEAIRIAKKYRDLVAAELPLKALYLFGSYSKGTFTAESDIDIAVILSESGRDYFSDAPLLWKIGRKVSYLIEPVLLKEDGNPLYNDVMKTGIAI